MKRLLLGLLVLAANLVGCPLCGPGPAEKILMLCVEHVSVAPDLDGQPWQSSGGAPRVMPSLTCPASTNQPGFGGPPQQGWDVHWQSLQFACCQYRSEGALLGDDVTVQVANVKDTMTWETIMAKTTIRVLEADLAAGSKHVGAVEGMQGMDFSLAPGASGLVAVTLQRVVVAPDNLGTPWDRDGSPPDVELLWESGQRVALGEGGDLHPALDLGQWDRNLLLQEGLRFALLDADEQEWIVSPTPVNYSSGDLGSGEHVFAPLQHALEVRLTSKWEDIYYGCD